MSEPLKQVKDENVSDLPYHNKETEKIAAEREIVTESGKTEADLAKDHEEQRQSE